VADSAFNEGELREAGYGHTAVVSLLIDMTGGGEPPDPALLARLGEAKAAGGADFLFVGKVSPHKAPHDLVKMLAVYRRLYDPEARLHLVGSPLGERYGPALDGFVERLGLTGAVTVTGSVPPAVLEAYYAMADVFVCASEHEGFCVPLVEAMGHGVPVVAYGVTAVPETVGQAGLVLDDKEPARFAAAVARVMGDPELRRRLAAAAAERVEAYSVRHSLPRFVDLVRQAVGAA
jgi:glycosyltransferase involved in cell wall biosynthesis